MNKNKLRTLYDNIGLPRIIIFLFLIILCICMPILKLQTTSLLAQAVTRIFMNMVLVLAMVPSIECGIGMNYGLPLGVLCGLFGGMISMELGLSGAACFFLAMALGILLACGVGYGYAQLLNRVAGQESMITTYVGFSSVSLMCMVWMLLPVKNEAIRFPMGSGLRNTVALDKFFYHILNDFLNIKVSESASIPGGLILFVLLLCTLVAIFQRSHMGVIMKTAGSNPRYARAIGINVNKIKIIVYSLCGLLASLAGIIEVARLSSAQPTAGTGYELDAIAAVVLGGTSLAGGKGRIVGTLIGALILGFLNNGLNLLGVSSYYQMIVKAVVILLAVLVDNKKQ